METSGEPLIPRSVFFENPTRALAQISPDGQWLAYLAEHDAVLNIWVAPVHDLAQAKPVTSDKNRGILNFSWAHNSQHLLYPQDEGGNENFHIFASDIVQGGTKDLTPYDNVAAVITRMSRDRPQEILVGLNDRDPRYHDLYRIEIESGQRTLVAKNEQGFAAYATDDQYQVKMAIKSLPDGGMEFVVPDPKGEWSSFRKIAMEDALGTAPISFDKTGRFLYAFDSQGRDTAALVSIDLETKATQVLAADYRADAGRVMLHPTLNTIQAVGFDYDRLQWKLLDTSIEGHWEALSRVTKGQFEVVSRTHDDVTWIVLYVVSDGPARYYRYNRQSKKADYLFSNRPALEKLQLPELRPVIIPAQDGLNLVSYLTVPLSQDLNLSGRPSKPLPLVLVVHGGPWARDSWGFNGHHQWLANRGYAVLSVNFRGSTGFGKKFVNAGNFEWAGKMHQDLLDAVDWAVREKIADPQKVAIYGGSYGGYATLVGLTFTPDRFACGVDIVGPSNLNTLLASVPPYWQPMIEMFTQRVGDPKTEEGRKLLTDRSPLHRAEAIKKPLLIGHGANDPRVNKAEADQIVKAMQEKKIPVTYALYPDEGHGFAKPKNRLSFNAIAESFLSACLGGAYQAIGDDVIGSSLQVPTGAEHVPGLAQALKERK